jgi:hypothetical protein
MYKANLDISMASLKVCQALGRTNLTKWIYTQLLTYKPKKQPPKPPIPTDLPQN